MAEIRLSMKMLTLWTKVKMVIYSLTSMQETGAS